MSMQVNHIRHLLQAALPLLFLIGSVSLATWSGLQSTTFPTGTRLVLHHALTTMPPALSEMGQETNQTLADHVGSDPFFRNLKKGTGETLNNQEIANLEEIHLSTIAQGKQGRYCIINGKIFHEGQEGKGFIVKEIAKGQVVFQTSLQNFPLIPGQKAAIQAGRLVPMEKEAIATQLSHQKQMEVPNEKQI